MLPEKKKKLIIGIIAIIVIIIVVFLLGKLSSFIKDKGKETKERRNDSYSEKFKYIGIFQDEDKILNLYGIDEEETSLGVRTFYDILDIKLINEKLVLYSDATNELRYDKTEDEYYFYELDTKYNNNYKIRLANKYVVSYSNKTLSYWAFDSKEVFEIRKNLENDTFFVTEDNVYFLDNTGLYEYNLDEAREEKIIKLNESDEVVVIGVTKDYIILTINEELYGYKKSGSVRYKPSDYLKEEYVFIDITDNGFIYKQDNILKEYSFITNRVLEKEVYFEYEILSSLYLGDEVYYFKINDKDKEKYVIMDMKEKKIIKELDNDYLYMVKL